MDLVDINGVVYTLDPTFTVKSYSFKKRSRTMNIAYRDGGKNVGDSMVDIRKIDVEGIIGGTDAADYRIKLNALFSVVNKTDLKLYIDAGKYINVAIVSDINHGFFEGAFNRASKISFSCICEDPFFYYDTVDTTTTTIIATPTQFTITNSGLYDLFPKIIITAAATISTLQLKNMTDDNNYFSYVDAAFLSGESVEMDSDAGTLFKASVNVIDKMSGNFLKLLPGANLFEYTGAACAIQVVSSIREL